MIIFGFILFGLLSLAAAQKDCFIISGSDNSFLFNADTATSRQILIGDIKNVGHSGDVDLLAYSNNGLYLASVAQDKSVRIWDLTRNELGYLLRGSNVNRLAFTPNNRRIVLSSYDYGSIYVLNTTTGEQLLRIPAPGVTCIALSPDSRSVAVGSETGADLRSLADGKIRKIIETLFPVTSISFSPNGEYLIYLRNDGSNEVQILDFKSNSPIESKFKDNYPIEKVLFHPLNSLVFYVHTKNKTLYKWSLREKMELRRYLKVDAFSVNSEGILTFSSFDEELITNYHYEENNRNLYNIGNNYKNIKCVESNPKNPNQIAIASENLISIYEYASEGKSMIRKARFGSPNWKASKVLTKPTNSSVVALGFQFQEGFIGIMSLRSPANGMVKHISKVKGIFSIAYSYDGRYFVSGSDDGKISLFYSRTENWSTKDSIYRTIGELPYRHTGEVLALAFSPTSNLLASSGRDGKVILSSIIGESSSPTIKRIAEFSLKEGSIKILSFSKDGHHLASGSDDHQIILWYIKKIQRPVQVYGHNAPVTGVAFDPKVEMLVTSSLGGEIFWWNITSSPIKLQNKIEIDSSVLALTLDKDGERIVTTAANETIFIWDWSGNVLKSVNVSEQGEMESIDFSVCYFTERLSAACNYALLLCLCLIFVLKI